VAVKKLVELAAESAKDTAKFISEDVRDLATKHGWDPETVDGVSVNYDDSSFSLNIAPEVEHSAMNLEYGTETTAPTAVFRKYASNTKKAEQVFIRGLEKRIGVLL
jgi:hypothetical protein